MNTSRDLSSETSRLALLTFCAITFFYFFESAQMSYFTVLAPYYLSQHIYEQKDIAALSASYYYGDMIGLLPVGLALDRFPLRKILLWAIIGSVISAFVLAVSQDFYTEWIARFFCGFFGGTFSFIGGIRVLANLFSKRFAFFIGVFLSAGMLGGLMSQYPLLVVANHFGIAGAMFAVTIVGILVCIVNFFYLHPVEHEKSHKTTSRSTLSSWQIAWEILCNRKNWFDCLMIVLLDTPVSIIGTLWGVVVLMSFYHFSADVSAWLVMSLFAGLMVGSPLWGVFADRFNHSAWLITIGAGFSFLLLVAMLLFPHFDATDIAILFFALGIFSSCQTLGFSWLTKNMRPELIGINSAFNSMIFMGMNGGFKQIGAYLLAATPFVTGISSSANLVVFIAIALLIATIYACMRRFLVR